MLEQYKSTAEEQAKLKAEALAVDDRAYRLYNDTDWKHYQSQKEVTISYKRSPDFNGDIFKMEMTLDAPLDRVVSVLVALHERIDWDPDVKQYIIEELDENTAVVHTTYITTGFAAKIMSPRDFCRLEYFKKHSDGMISSTYTSIEYPGCPHLKGFVRGGLYTSGIYCKQNLKDGSKTDFIVIFQIDIKIYVPRLLLRYSTCRRGFQLAENIRLACQEQTDNAEQA